MSSEAMKAIFDNLTSGAGRRAKLEYNIDSVTHCEANSIKVNVKSARLSTQMHVTDWAEAQREDPEIRDQSHHWLVLPQEEEIRAMDGGSIFRAWPKHEK